jgi:rhodanese-related sulfurtransferase
LNKPLTEWVDRSQAEEIIAKGGRWLDVRLPSEFESSHAAGAINIPLYFIRLKLNTLDPKTTYVMVCDTGRRSSAGSFILNERGFNTRVLRGGFDLARV